MTELNLVFLLKEPDSPGSRFWEGCCGKQAWTCTIYSGAQALLFLCRTVESQGFDSVGAVSGTLNRR